MFPPKLASPSQSAGSANRRPRAPLPEGQDRPPARHRHGRGRREDKCQQSTGRCRKSRSGQRGRPRERDRPAWQAPARRARSSGRSPSAHGFLAPTDRAAPAAPAWRGAGRSCSSGSNAAASRPQIALALAVESCCATMMAASPAKPSGRRRSGGRPAVAIERAEARIGPAQCGEAGVEIAVGMDVGLHGRCRDLIG